METALYGRMRSGRCDVRGNVGCQGNAMEIMDHACSGRSYCNHRIINDDFSDLHTCESGRTGYLEATHRCMEGRYFSYYILVY